MLHSGHPSIAECSNCGAKYTPIWRRGLDDELNCNACGSYYQLHKRRRPKNLRFQSRSFTRDKAYEIMVQCYNCLTTATPYWGKDKEGRLLCNTCVINNRSHSIDQPSIDIHQKKDSPLYESSNSASSDELLHPSNPPSLPHSSTSTRSSQNLPRRLLNTRSLCLFDFDEDEKIPVYAILSHQWVHRKEVTFAEVFMPQDRTKKKSGYQKILCACELARRDNIEFIWIDTCCIDKRDCNDVARNIKSMYGYYQHARVCYAFLGDHDSKCNKIEDSKWFTRGWTLQELLAPRRVKFFDKHWVLLGGRNYLAHTISLKTGIPLSVLRREVPVWDFNMKARLSWALRRETTEPEDMAYCLLGLLGVSMEPCYGEGTQQAFKRLHQLLAQVYRNFSLKDCFIDQLPRRLIDVHTLRLVEFPEYEPTPPYAILSHQWIKGEEVGFTEFLEHRDATKSKWGYAKILKACAQTSEHGFSFLWVDTCCIDKGNHDDVARNIKSMYAYYEHSQVCYAFLVDVSSSNAPDEMKESEWFSRGWTLQELLAPRQVIFFDSHWDKIGDKSALSSIISSATGIPEPVLSKEIPQQNVSLEHRLSWSIQRQTTKPEDQAYCLLGILNVSMEPRYGEGVRAAFNRLEKTLIRSDPKACQGWGKYYHDIYSMLSIWNTEARLKIIAQTKLVIDELDPDWTSSWAAHWDSEAGEPHEYLPFYY